jgi:hypothetical protein
MQFAYPYEDFASFGRLCLAHCGDSCEMPGIFPGTDWAGSTLIADVTGLGSPFPRVIAYSMSSSRHDRGLAPLSTDIKAREVWWVSSQTKSRTHPHIHPNNFLTTFTTYLTLHHHGSPLLFESDFVDTHSYL